MASVTPSQICSILALRESQQGLCIFQPISATGMPLASKGFLLMSLVAQSLSWVHCWEKSMKGFLQNLCLLHASSLGVPPVFLKFSRNKIRRKTKSHTSRDGSTLKRHAKEMGENGDRGEGLRRIWEHLFLFFFRFYFFFLPAPGFAFGWPIVLPRRLMPRALSILPMICWFGIALPCSY